MSNNRTKLTDIEVLPVIAEIFFVLTFALKAFTDGPYIRGEVSSTVAYIKYGTALLACFAAAACMLRRGETRFVSEFNKLILIVVVFTMLSAVMQLKSGETTATTYIELAKLAMPMVLAYCMLNALSDKELYSCMFLVLIVSIAGYVVELRTLGVSAASVFQANFFSSESETESSSFSEIALMLSFYFLYSKRSTAMSFVSTLFCLLCFKRLAMLVVVFAFIGSFLAPRLITRRVPDGFIRFCKVITLGICGLWCWLLLKDQEELFVSVFGKTPFEFTMGRSESLRYLVEGGFQSYGFGSTNDLIKSVFGVPFEMDFAKIAIELTPVALAVFVWLFWDLGKGSVWAYVIVCYYMLNMITSDSLTSNFSFSLAYMTIGIVNSGSLLGGGLCGEISTQTDRRDTRAC